MATSFVLILRQEHPNRHAADDTGLRMRYLLISTTSAGDRYQDCRNDQWRCAHNV